MAKAIATCTCSYCGQIFEKVAYKRNRAEADSWKEWAEKNINQCPDCYREGEVKKAAEAAQAAGLPELTGSPKQIAWAEQIRAKLWSAYMTAEAQSEAYAKEHDCMEEWQQKKEFYRSVFQRVTSAKEYIENSGGLHGLFAKHIKDC